MGNCIAMSRSCHSHDGLLAHALDKGTGDHLQWLCTLECRKTEIFIKNTKGCEEDCQETPKMRVSIARMSKSEAKCPQSEPKDAQSEPKGSHGEPKMSRKEPKGIQ